MSQKGHVNSDIEIAVTENFTLENAHVFDRGPATAKTLEPDCGK